MSRLPAPLFVDPVFDGAADPTLFWHHDEQAWWLIYTNRRATVEEPGFAWMHGTDIGIAASRDGGLTWTYEGIWEGLDFEPGRNTFWAPEVLWHDGRWHAYVSYVPGIFPDWNAPRHIHHYTSTDARRWKWQSRLPLTSDKCIDACVHRMPSGRWRLWYKDEGNHSHTYAAESADLFSWEPVGQVLAGRGHEGANVFFFSGCWWLLTDEWRGQAVWCSDDALHWTRQSYELLGTPGVREGDATFGRHADVLILGERAVIVYFTHPGGDDHRLGPDGYLPAVLRRTVLQAAALTCDGERLICNRDAPCPPLPPSPGLPDAAGR